MKTRCHTGCLAARWAAVGLILTGWLMAAQTQAQQTSQSAPWPSRPVRVVVNFPAGGPLDALARQVSGSLSGRLGQPFAVENVTGAAGEIGASAVARAQPDGHTILMSIDAPFTIARAMRPQAGARIDDFTWVSLMGTSGLVFAVHPSVGVRSLAELIALGRTRSLNFSTAGPGSPGHLAAAVLGEVTGVQANPIHYRGNAPAVLAVVSGEVNAGILSTPGMLPHIRSGKLTGLAIAAERRSPLLPDLPTVGEAGHAALAQESLYVVGLPSRAPESLVRALSVAIGEALADPAARERFVALDMSVSDAAESSRAEARLRELLDRYTKVVKATGLKAE